MYESMTSQQLLDTVIELLYAFPKDRPDLDARQRVMLMLTAVKAASLLQGVAAVVTAEADKHEASMRTCATPTGTFLANRTHLSKKQAAALVFDAHRVESHPQVKDAVLSGRITYDHGRAVGRAMEQLPSSFTPIQTEAAETLLVTMAARVTPDDLIRAASRVAEQISPVDADENEAARLARERDAAWQGRTLTWHQQRGTLTFQGSLPQVEGEAFTSLIQAYMAQAKHNDSEAHDPKTEDVAPWQRRADGLIALIRDASTKRLAPALAGDRPCVIVTLDYDALKARAAHAGLLPNGQPLAAGDLRRLCCDANLIPAVLGAQSEPLDVGRAGRFVTPAIRKALTLRDKTCAFPHCDTPAVACDAHHLTPWWNGGSTSLNNMVLLCGHHHGLVEPDRNASRDQWSVTIHPQDGYPVFKPPDRYPDRTPLRNTNAPPIPGDEPLGCGNGSPRPESARRCAVPMRNTNTRSEGRTSDRRSCLAHAIPLREDQVRKSGMAK